jgi:hypothetical protein
VRLGAPRPTRGARLVLAALLVLTGTGCAAASHSWRAGPAGISAERQLRQQLMAGQYEAAWEALKSKEIAPSDALLRHMYKGVVALHAGELETGARSMDRAWQVAYQRWTKRVGDGAMAMVTSDAALPYDPGPAERMFIPYYGGLTWLARNEAASAAVEARRLSTLLESDQGPQAGNDLRGVMRYVAGVMYEVAGERNDADVSFRNAALLLGTLPGDTIAPDAAHGDVVILIEDGFVGRPEPASMTFWYNDGELKHLQGDDDGVRLTTVGELRRRRHMQRDWAMEKYNSVSIAWPEFSDAPREEVALGARALAPVVLVSDSVEVKSVPAVAHAADTVLIGGMAAHVISADVTASVRADFEREQPARLGRAIARAIVREAALKAAGDSFEKAMEKDKDDDDDKKKDGKGKAIGHVLLGIGLLATGATSAVLDQPDLRAWQLLPDRVSVARLRLPVGDHQVEVMRGGEAVSLGTVSVRPGGITVLTHRWWPPQRGARTLVENGREVPDYLTRGADVVDPRDGLAGLPVVAPGVVPRQ